MDRTGAETGCKDETMGRVPPGDFQGMRYYPAFGVKSGADARFRRGLRSGIKVLPRFPVHRLFLTIHNNHKRR
jgi:hypothetical protein